MTREEISPLLPYLEAIGCDIINREQGFVRCPGEHWHTTPNAQSDCKLYNNGHGFFQIHCHHTSCRHRVEHVNRVLPGFANQRTQTTRPRHSGEAYPSSDQSESDKAEMAREAWVEIRKKYHWSRDEIVAASDDAINEPVEQHHYQIFGLFQNEDLVWCGRDIWDTGSPKHRVRFRPTEEWLAEAVAPGSFTCGSTFKSGTYSRSVVNIAERKFLIVESDTLSHDEIGSIFRWLDKAIGVRLRAVIDTGGKSLHGWFDHPSPAVTRQLKNWLPRLGCDPALFNPVQPCRLPGALRPGSDKPRYQRLIFVAKGGDSREG